MSTNEFASDSAAEPAPGPDAETALRSGDRAEGDGTYTVSDLCNRVGQALGEAFPDQVWVQGAISGLTRSNNGHVYFDLVDPEETVGRSARAVLPVALFSSSRQLVNRIMRRSGGIRMHDGVEIRIRGEVAYYPPQGRVQLVMSLIDPQYTLGQLAAARQALLDRLSDEGLLDRNHGRPFPALPLRIGLITSDRSAAYHDFVDELTSSGYPFRITLVDSRVQGIDAVPGLAAALRLAGTGADGDGAADFDVDVMVVARGGGARTDLAVFDHEMVARAIAGCPLPVIVGVGHETDRSVADEVAHTSVKTPTAAARTLIEAVAAFETRLDDATHRVRTLTHLHLDRANHRLVGGGARLVASARRTVERQRVGLEQSSYRLQQAPGRLLERADAKLELAEVRLAANDPIVALRRGWTITYLERNGSALVRRAGQVTVGDRIRTVTAEGGLVSTVEAMVPTDRDPETDD